MALLERGDVTGLLETGEFSEGPQIEAKQGLRGFPRNAWETVSAFANTNGGVIVVGLAEDGDDWRIEGVSNPEATIQEILVGMRNPQKISVEVANGSDIWTEEIEGRPLVVLRVRPAPLQQKPVNNNGTAWIRRGEADSRCTPLELDRMARDASTTSFDAGVLPFLDENDFDQESVYRYRLRSMEVRPNLPHHAREGRDYLKAIGAWRVDRERGIEGPTRAGILVLGTPESIQSIRDNHRIDYRRTTMLSTASDRYADRLEWSGSLFDAWEEIFPKLTVGLPVPFRLQGAQRIERPAGQDALREAFVNLLVHTDYQEIDDAVVVHRHDGYRFRNPGQSRVNVEHLGVDDASVRRNQKIAEMFSHVGLADRAGSGYMRIFDEWHALGFRRPHILSDPVSSEFVLDLSLTALIPPNDRNWLDSYGENWAEDEELALWLARRQGRIDNQTLREQTGQHMSDASRTLVSLKNREFLISQGSGRNTYYVLGRQPELDMRTPRTDSDHLGTEGDRLPPEPDHSRTEGDLLSSEPRYQQAATLLKIAQSLRDSKRSPSSDEVRDTLLLLCAVEPLSIEQLVDITQRKAPTLRRYIQQLQNEHRIRKADRIPGIRHARFVTVSLSTAQQQSLNLSETQ